MPIWSTSASNPSFWPRTWPRRFRCFNQLTAPTERTCELADFAATATEPAWHVACVALGKALAEYRRDRFDSAHDWADRAIASESIFPRHQATAYFIKAAAYAREQQIELAHTALGKGDAVLKHPYRVFREVVGDTWCDWIIAEHLRREAVELLQRPAPAAPP